jgi:hypothetical protein
MAEPDRWRRAPPPERGPSAPPRTGFDPVATGLGVFFAVAVPIFVIGYTRTAGPDALTMALAPACGLIAALLAGVWAAHRRAGPPRAERPPGRH